MNNGFNAYHKWLGIPVDKCPPTYYDLLQISEQEQDRAVIQMAVERQKTHLEQFRTAKQAKTVDQLVYELEEAELTLLNPEMREEYDQRVLPVRDKKNRSRAGSGPGFGENQQLVGESSGLLQGAGGIILILAVSFSIMAASVYLLPWKQIHPQQAEQKGNAAEEESVPQPVSKAAADNETPETAEKTSVIPRPQLLVSPFTQQTALERRQAWSQYLNQSPELTNSLGIKMLLIPPGEFQMGNSAAEVQQILQVFATENTTLSADHTERINSSLPQHEVVISQPFRMSQQEITQSMFRKFIEATGYQPDSQKDGEGGYAFVNGKLEKSPEFSWQTDYGLNRSDVAPVVNISWNDATAFCKWLSETEGKKYRLPTEAEWEYACRAGTTTMFSFGDALTEASSEVVKEYAWFSMNTVDARELYPHPVMAKKSNPFGLSDMHGNVYEWCQDLYDANYYSSLDGKKTVDPQGTDVPHSSHIIRGGCWFRGKLDIRSGYRDWLFNSSRNLNVGFRIVCETDATAVASP